jgi:hypothetical protein
MVTHNQTPTPVRALLTAWVSLARAHAAINGQPGLRDVKIYLDCDEWLEEEIRPEADFIEYVDDKREADVCMIVAPEESHGVSRHYRVRFVGLGRFAMIEASARLHLPREVAGFPRRCESRSGFVTPTQPESTVSRLW